VQILAAYLSYEGGSRTEAWPLARAYLEPGRRDDRTNLLPAPEVMGLLVGVDSPGPSFTGDCAKRRCCALVGRWEKRHAPIP
jgi:hypothetical protein